MEEGNRTEVGTQITLFLNEDCLEFANEYRAKTITETHQYCDELLGKMEGDMIGVVDLIRQSRAAIHNQ